MGEQACCVCRCTQGRACSSGCSWVRADLCSVCCLIGDVMMLVAAVCPRTRKRLIDLVEEALEEALEDDDRDARRLEKVLANLRLNRMIERVGSREYQVTKRGRRVARDCAARVRSDLPSCIYLQGAAA